MLKNSLNCYQNYCFKFINSVVFALVYMQTLCSSLSTNIRDATFYAALLDLEHFNVLKNVLL